MHVSRAARCAPSAPPTSVTKKGEREGKECGFDFRRAFLSGRHRARRTGERVLREKQTSRGEADEGRRGRNEKGGWR